MYSSFTKGKDIGQEKMKYLKYIIVTTITGLLFFLLGEVIFNNWIEDNTPIVFVPIYFFIFMLIESIVLAVLSLTSGKFERYQKRKKKEHCAKKIVILLILLLPITSLLEFLYELGGKQKNLDATSYVFIVDDSGSMKESDPQKTRRDSIGSIMEELKSDLPYAVYLFNDTCWNVKTMSKAKAKNYDLRSSGGTNIKAAINEAIDDYLTQKNTWGTAPKIMLLTDGYSSDSGLSSVIRRCRKNDVVVSTVGFGNADEEYLKRLANNTGGAYVKSTNVSTLRDSMKQALTEYSNGDRNLLSDRFASNDWLYTILRILFLIIISVIIAMIKGYATIDPDRLPIYIGFSLIFGIVASVLMEVLISHFYISTKLVHLICCILWALLPAENEPKNKNKVEFKPINFDEEGGSGNSSGPGMNTIKNRGEEDDDRSRFIGL